MKYISLATRYRPQRFDELAGQDLIKTALSKAAAENRVAPGYLLAGTRGVGKTTIARIFAKALNCEHAPCAEPCNECSACKRIAQGAYPDVIELDGASNNKVEDARELKEKVGFAPMEGRYKIFIIDEAHMLSNAAFNALLKTLEEPPAHVVFIFATTEIHKFPPTILSRCQVFSFSHLQEETLIAHLGKVLDKEQISYEPDAVRLIAHRGAGSARDSMSLLDQVLSFGPPKLTADFVRSVLGLVSQDILENLLSGLASGNCGDVALYTKELVSKQIDIRYFVRELTDTIRSLFLLQTCGRETVARLGLSDNELDFLERIAPKFRPGYLHAAWQMLLDSGRSLMPSSGQDPAAALEFLLVNMALLPRLLPAEVAGRTTPAQNAAPAGTQPHPAPAATPVTTAVTNSSTASTTANTTANKAASTQQNFTQAVRPQPAQTVASQTASNATSQQAAAPKPANWQQQQQARQAQSAAPAQPVQPQPVAHTPPVQTRPVQPQPEQTAPAQAQPAQAGTVTAPDADKQADAKTAGTAKNADEAPCNKPELSGQAMTEGQTASTTADTATVSDDVPSPAVEKAEAESATEDTGTMGSGQADTVMSLEKIQEWLGLQCQNPALGHRLRGFSCSSANNGTVILEGGSVHQTESLKSLLPQLEADLSSVLHQNVRITLKASQEAIQNAGCGHAQPEMNRPELKYCIEILNAHVDHVRRR